MSYNLENGVSWEEISPSLKKYFKDTQASISKLNENLNKQIRDAKQREKDAEAAIKKAIDEFNLDYLGLAGAKGQVVRTDVVGGQLYADDNFFELRAITDPIKKEDIWNVDLITLKEVCATWERRSWGSAFGSDDLAGAKSSWTYDDTNKGISNHGNWNSVGSFGSTKKYDYFWIKMSMNSVEPDFVDDDWIGFIPIYLSEDESPDGQIHTIMVGRVGNADTQWNQYPGNLCLIYDFGKSTQIILDYIPRSVFGNTRWQKGWYTSLYVFRKGGNIQAASSNPQQQRNQTYLLGDGQYINWSLPKTKPADWPQASYDIICQMMDGPSKIGFWTCSNDCIFYLDDQDHLMRPNDIIIDFNTIYEFDFKTGKYKNARSLQIEDIPLRSFVYNALTEQFYWYKQPNQYTEIKQTYIVDPTKTNTNTTGPFSLIDSNYDTYDGYLRYCRVYNNGWCEQGGYFSQDVATASNPANITGAPAGHVYVKFKIPFKTADYLVTYSNQAKSSSDVGDNWAVAMVHKYTDKMECGRVTQSKGAFYHAEGYVDLNTYKSYINQQPAQPQPQQPKTQTNIYSADVSIAKTKVYPYVANSWESDSFNTSVRFPENTISVKLIGYVMIPFSSSGNGLVDCIQTSDPYTSIPEYTIDLSRALNYNGRKVVNFGVQFNNSHPSTTPVGCTLLYYYNDTNADRIDAIPIALTMRRLFFKIETQ